MFPSIRRHLFAAALGSLLPTVAGAQPIGSSVGPTLDNPNRLAVTGVPALRRLFQLAASRRVDICIVGDSNARANSCGHETGMGLAFGARFGTYATAVEPVAGLNGWGASIASCSSFMFPPFTLDNGPAQMSLFSFANEGFPSSYAHLDDGASADPSYNTGLVLLPQSPIDITGPLRYHATHWIYGPASGGYMNPSCRPAWPGNAYTNYAAAPTISSAGPMRLLKDFSLDVLPGARTPDGLLFCCTDAAGARDARGPLCLTWNRVENTSRATGIAYSPLWAQGGQSAYHACLALQTAGAAPREWFRQATRLQSAPPVLLVQVLHGGNDVNSHIGSLGPIGGLDSSTAAGQEDNTRGIILAIRNSWVVSGRDPANLFFLLGPYHPVPYPNSPQPAYEQGWQNIAAGDPQVSVIAGTMLTTAAELSQKGYLSGGVDIAHLSVSGFVGWGRAAVSALDRALCPADFDENGTPALADIFAYLNAWFALDKSADFNYSGTLETQDIFDFLGAWFAGC